MRDLQCMSFIGKDQSQLLVAGCQDVMFKIDVEKGKVLESVRASA
jgi:PAB-dependent poly(A)-specific ribonuclease subunit 2